MFRRFAIISCLVASLISIVEIPQVQAATVVATGTSADVCNQDVSISSGITAQRSGQFCIVTFTNTTETTWKVPVGVSSISAIIVGGGGGGGDSTSGATGGGGGAGGYFQNSNILVSGSIAIAIGAGGSGSSRTTQADNGGTSYIGTLKVGGGGGGNGVTYAGGARAKSGVGGADFVSSGSGGGGRPTGTAGYTNEYLGGDAGAYAASGISFLGFTYTGLQGVSGSRNSDGASGGFGGYISPASSRTSTISGASVVYSKISDYRAWEDALTNAGTKTPGSGGSPNYSYGVEIYGSGGAGADGIVIIKYAISAYIATPTYSGELTKGILESVTVTVNASGKVRFFFDGKRIPGCVSISTTGTAPNLIATCNWKPSVTGRHQVHATFTPTDSNIAISNSGRISIFVFRRSTTR
jgi:hypothetical protein